MRLGEKTEVDAQVGQVRVAESDCDTKGACVYVCVFNFSLPFTTHIIHTLIVSLSLPLFLCAEGEVEKVVEVEEIEVDGAK